MCQNYIDTFPCSIEESNYITSPNYPNQYDSGIWYVWNLESCCHVHLMIKDLQTEECCDYLSIYEGDSSNNELIGRYSGNRSQIEIDSTGNKLFLEFKTDGSVVGRGFSINYISFKKGKYF